MTEMVNGMNQGSETNSQPATSATVSTSSPVVDDKSFKQSEVNDIVKRAKHDAVETFRRMQTEQPNYVQQKYPDSVSQNQNQNIPNPDAPLTQERVRQLAAEETQRLRDQWTQEAYNASQAQEAQRIALEFTTKINAGKSKYQDFDKSLENIDLGQYSSTVQISNMFDNAADIWYTLANDPVKLEGFNSFASKNPKAAYEKMHKLSQSLKDNEVASNMRVPNEPLSKLRPSNTGTDNGVMSISDARRKYKV